MSSETSSISQGLQLELEKQKKKVIDLSARFPQVSHKTSENSLMTRMVNYCEKKRLFVCCDGTWQNASGSVEPLTNVAKLARAVYRLGDDDFQVPQGKHGLEKNWLSGAEYDRYGIVRQVVYYSSGVGSESSSLFDSGYSGATGKGVTKNLLNAYCFICNNYNFVSEQDEIILVGFSRGAFTVRCLAHFISAFGLLRRKGLAFLRKVYRSWKEGEGTISADLLHALRPLYTTVRIKVLAEWDTVSAIGLGSKLSFVNSSVPKRVDHAFLALSLHEKRKKFQPLLWKATASKLTRVEQCAFVGCHSDIGGGNRDPGLSTISLLWMISKITHASKASFDNETLLQFLTPLDEKSLRPWKKPQLQLWNLATTKGLVTESRVGLWVIMYYITLGRYHGKRDPLIAQYTQSEQGSQLVDKELLQLQLELQQTQNGEQQEGQQQQNNQSPQLVSLEHLFAAELKRHQTILDYRQQRLTQGQGQGNRQQKEDIKKLIEQKTSEHEQLDEQQRELDLQFRRLQGGWTKKKPQQLRDLREPLYRRWQHVGQQLGLLQQQLNLVELQDRKLKGLTSDNDGGKDKRAKASIIEEYWRLKQAQWQLEDETENTMHLKVHFTVRLLFNSRYKEDPKLDPGLKCGFFRNYEPTDGRNPQIRNEWTRVGHTKDRSFMEDTIDSMEKELLDEWFKVAEYWRDVDKKKGPNPLNDGDDWTEIMKHLQDCHKENIDAYGKGCKEEDSLEYLIRKEFKNLGIIKDSC